MAVPSRAAGVSFLNKLVLLDRQNAELRVLPNTAAASMAGPSAPYLGKGIGGLPSLPPQLPSGTVDAILDTGNDSALLLPLETIDGLSLAGELEEEIGTVVSVWGSEPVYEGQIKGDVRVGPLTLNNPTVRFVEVAIRTLAYRYCGK